MRFPFHPLTPIILITAITSSAPAATLHVPDDYSTIQSCIDAAASGQDECVVAPGTYNELINFLGKAITLRSSHGPEVTTIDGTGLNGDAVTCNSQESPETIIDGFTICGAIINKPGSPTIRNCDFIDGAIYGECYFDEDFQGGCSSPTIMDCNFTPGTIVIYEGSGTISNCLFLGNQSRAITLVWSSLKIINCSFIGNLGGVLSIGNDKHRMPWVLISNSIFIGNSASNGGAIISHGHGAVDFSNCVFTKNTATLVRGIYDTNTFLHSTIAWENGPHQFLDAVVAAYSNIPTASVDYDEGGLKDQDPLFVRSPDPGPDGLWNGIDDDYGDLRLHPDSPCIDAGEPNYPVHPDDPLTDLDGHARVLCGRMDMGAYEFGIGDYDCNQTINLRDVAGLQNCFTGDSASRYNPGCESLDFEFDADVDLNDLAQFNVITNP